MAEALGTDVLVVGAGPVGLLLAGDLRAGGARVIVLEQLTQPTTESRATILHARTMALFAERGILGRLGPLPGGGLSHFGGIRLDLAAADPSNQYAGQWECPQTRVEAVLQEWATDLGAEVWRGYAVTTLTQHVDRVEAGLIRLGGRPQRLAAGYLVGCDGQRSTVRQLAGFELAGAGGTRQLLRADVAGVDLPGRRLEQLPDGIATAAGRADGTTRLMVHQYGRAPGSRVDEPDFAEVADAWAAVTGEDIRGGTPVWLNRFDDTIGQATQYRRDRVLLAGDAAHLQPPIGGQALNLGLQDAAGLGWRLAARVTGRARDDLLDAYHRERHRAGARTLTNIRAQAHLLFGGPEVAALREAIGELLEIDVVRVHLARMISGLEPHGTSRATVSASSCPLSSDRSSTMDRLTGRTALVTGASRGIGRATAVRLGREGALVAVHYATNESGARETIATIEQEGGRAFGVPAEFGEPGDVHQLFLALERELKERTGETRLDILVNNAAATSVSGTAPEDVTPEQFDRQFAVNVRAPFFIVQRALGLLPEGGRVINISSGLTRSANPVQLVYSMTKGALEQLTLHLARHLGPRGITINTVAPGITNNGNPVFDDPEIVEQMARLSAFGRVGEAGEVADVVTFLATDEAGWITGTFVDASGGTLLG